MQASRTYTWSCRRGTARPKAGVFPGMKSVLRCGISAISYTLIRCGDTCSPCPRSRRRCCGRSSHPYSTWMIWWHSVMRLSGRIRHWQAFRSFAILRNDGAAGEVPDRWPPALDRVRVGSLSRPESLQRLQLVRAGLPEPELNVRVQDRRGRLISMADLVWREYRTLIEYEGDGHRTSRTKFRSDITRGERYADGDWFPMRSHAGDVFGDPNDLIRRVSRRLRSRGWDSRGELRQVAAARR